jgi:hypothetical protein
MDNDNDRPRSMRERWAEVTRMIDEADKASLRCKQEELLDLQIAESGARTLDGACAGNQRPLVMTASVRRPFAGYPLGEIVWGWIRNGLSMAEAELQVKRQVAVGEIIILYGGLPSRWRLYWMRLAEEFAVEAHYSHVNINTYHYCRPPGAPPLTFEPVPLSQEVQTAVDKMAFPAPLPVFVTAEAAPAAKRQPAAEPQLAKRRRGRKPYDIWSTLYTYLVSKVAENGKPFPTYLKAAQDGHDWLAAQAPQRAKNKEGAAVPSVDTMREKISQEWPQLVAAENCG